MCGIIEESFSVFVGAVWDVGRKGRKQGGKWMGERRVVEEECFRGREKGWGGERKKGRWSLKYVWLMSR